MKKNITNDIYYVGVNDHQVDLFEGQYVVPNGMAYNSYVIMDEFIAVMDTVDQHFTDEWLKNIKEVLGDRKPNYLIVQHMEPDHSANIMNFLKAYPDAFVVGNAKTFKMMEQFFHEEIPHRVEVNEGDSLNLGKHVLTFVFAPMVHWPEVMFTYDSTGKVLFSADAFGKFGALDIEDPEGWDCEARRYYIGIVGKYGPQVQAVLKKAASIEIQTICPLHGPILSGDLSHYLKQYDIWSSYKTESEGVAIFYTSVYGHTKEAALEMAELLKANGTPKVAVSDLARDDMAECVEDAFRYGKIILATTTYNAGIFPFMHTFIDHLLERNFQNKQIGIIENGTWAPMAAKVIKDKLAGCKNVTILEPTVRILSSLDDNSRQQLQQLADKISEEYKAVKELKEEKAPELDPKALFKIGYGLYVVTSNDGNKDNGLIVNTVSQLTDTPLRVAVNINKLNYSHDVIKKTGILNVNCLNTSAPFSVFQQFGFQSGKNVNKFDGQEVVRSENGLVVLSNSINSFFSLKVAQYVDLGTHGMFICDVTESKIINNIETMTYNYYQANVKPKPDTGKKKGYVCKVCGYVYEGDTLPEDIICPLCKHGAADFEEIK
ncbi:MAG: flavin reductase [Bacilli bacterium]|nr:flavin reductase [Bacilli bacterium]